MSKMDYYTEYYDEFAKILTECLEGDRNKSYDLIRAIDKMHQRGEFKFDQFRCMVSDVKRRQSE